MMNKSTPAPPAPRPFMLKLSNIDPDAGYRPRPPFFVWDEELGDVVEVPGADGDPAPIQFFRNGVEVLPDDGALEALTPAASRPVDADGPNSIKGWVPPPGFVPDPRHPVNGSPRS